MPSPADLPQHERECADAVLEASRLAWVVHEYDREQVGRLIEHLEHAGKVRRVLVALAAMVDVDRPLSELVAWVDERHDRQQAEAEARRPWQRASYPPCLPELDQSPPGTTSPHGTPSRRNAGCRGEGCVLARKDYDSFRYAQRRREADETGPGSDLRAVRADAGRVPAVDDGARRLRIRTSESRREA